MPAHLAALTGEQAIVISGHLVSAHGTHLIQVFIVGIVHHFKLRGCKAQAHTQNQSSELSFFSYTPPPQIKPVLMNLLAACYLANELKVL